MSTSSVIIPFKNEVSVRTDQWTSSTFGCFHNVGISLTAFFLPCLSFGNTSQALGRGRIINTALWYWIPGVNCYFLTKQRQEIRDIRGIPGGFLGDLLCHLSCHCCSLAQEAVEVQSIRDDIVTTLANRGEQVLVHGNTVTTTPINHGQQYFPGMEPGVISRQGLEYQPDTSLHDMTPGPSLPPETSEEHSQQDNDIERY